MNKREKQALKTALIPMGETFKESFLNAMVLRCEVHVAVAMMNGAEPEDTHEIIARAVDSSAALTADFLNRLGEVEKAKGMT